MVEYDSALFVVTLSLWIPIEMFQDIVFRLPVAFSDSLPGILYPGEIDSLGNYTYSEIDSPGFYIQRKYQVKWLPGVFNFENIDSPRAIICTVQCTYSYVQLRWDIEQFESKSIIFQPVGLIHLVISTDSSLADMAQL